MPAKPEPMPRMTPRKASRLAEDAWQPSAPPPMPPPLPSSQPPAQSPPRDEDSPSQRTERFLMPADCLHLLQRPSDPQLRAIELLTQCRVRVYGDSGGGGPELSCLSVRYRDRCGDPRACERLLNSLLARRQTGGSGTAARLVQVSPKSPPSAAPAATAPAAADAADAVRLAICLGAIADDILRGSSFVHCCGLAFAAFATVEAALRLSSIHLRLPEERALDLDAATAGSSSSSSSCSFSATLRQAQWAPPPLRYPPSSVRLAWRRFAPLVRMSSTTVNLGVAMTITEESAVAAFAAIRSATLRASRAVDNFQLPPAQPLPSQEADDAVFDYAWPSPSPSMSLPARFAGSVTLGAEMLTRF